MVDPIAYKLVTLHSKRGDPAAEAFRQALAGAVYADLAYDDPTENNMAVATWFKNDLGIAPEFGDGPVLTYSEVIWTDPRNSENEYFKVKYCLRPEDMPLDMVAKAV
jgi:hypothetical protein